MQVKQQCSPGASTSLLDILFALEGMQVSERSKERDKWETCVWCSLALLQKPLPHCSGMAQSICLHHSAPKESHIWILCNHHWRCVVLSSSKWTEYSLHLNSISSSSHQYLIFVYFPLYNMRFSLTSSFIPIPATSHSVPSSSAGTLKKI